MTRDFPGELPNQELLSAFLDDELSPAERDQVEKHLAASEADRLLLAELKALRGELKGLPTVAVKPDFTDRVVRAAVAAAEKHDDAATTVGWAVPTTTADSTAPRPKRSRFRIMLGAAVASAAALAAAYLLVVQPWRDDANEVNPSILANKAQGSSETEPWLKPLRDAVPAPNEAVVIRLKVGNDPAANDALQQALKLAQPDGSDAPVAQALAAALERLGIMQWESNSPTGAKELVAAHQRAVEARQSAANVSNDELVSVSDAIFIEAPLIQVEGALKDAASSLKKPFTLAAESKLAFTRRESPVGEPGSREKAAKLPREGQAFAQRLDVDNLRVEQQSLTQSTAAPSPATPQQTVRILLLIEAN